MFLTDVLFNCARLNFSRAQQEALLDWANELGAHDLPTMYGLYKYQKEMKKELGDPTCRQVSAQGNIWYLNEIGESLAKVSSL